jgi:hypothetical protein
MSGSGLITDEVRRDGGGGGRLAGTSILFVAASKII